MAADTCVAQGESVSATVTKVCKHVDQHGKPVVLLTLTDGDVVALYLTSETCSALVGAMGNLCFNGVPLADLQAVHSFAVKAAAAANAMGPRDVRVVA